MTTIIVKDNTKQAKEFVSYTRTLPFVEVKRKKVVEPEFDLYKSLDSAFVDVRLMLDGKKEEKTAEEFLYEIQSMYSFATKDFKFNRDEANNYE